jgi:hypothetical protein
VIDWSTSQSKNKIDRHAVTHLNERVDGVRAHTAWKCSDLGVLQIFASHKMCSAHTCCTEQF